MTAATPQELRAEADRLESEAANAYRGKVYISDLSGQAHVHVGNKDSEYVRKYYREATETEILALRTIPEFAAHLDRIRGA